MKHLKTFESKYNYSSMEPFIMEMNLSKKIINFIKYHDLEYVDNIKINGEIYYITLGTVGSFNDILLKYKQPGDDTEEIMIGIPRCKGVDIYESILKQIEKMTEDDIILLKAKQASTKYNL